MGVVLILLPHALREGSSSQALLGFTLKDTNSLLCLPGLASFHFFFPSTFSYILSKTARFALAGDGSTPEPAIAPGLGDGSAQGPRILAHANSA